MIDLSNIKKKQLASILSSSENGALILTAEWSGKSHLMNAVIRRLVNDYDNVVKFVSIKNADKKSFLNELTHSNQFPTIVFIRSGEIAKRVSGLHSYEYLSKIIETIYRKVQV